MYGRPHKTLLSQGGSTELALEPMRNSLIRPACLLSMIGLTILSGFFHAPCLAQDSADGSRHALRATNRPKVGLALGGGGARGAAHVGVLKILEQQGIQIDCITGTNVGAIVGGLYSAGISISALEEMFTKKSLMHSYLTVPVKVRLMIVPLFFVPRVMGKRGYDGLYKGNKFRNFLNKYVPQSEQDIEDLKLPFGAIALNLVDGKVHTIKSGNLGTALQASSAIPILRKPVKIQDGLYVDGGVMNNVPVDEAKALGADIVIAVDLDDPKATQTASEFTKLGTVGQRVLTLHFANVDKTQLAKAEAVIRPEVDQIGLMSTNSKDAEAAIQAGERAAIESLDQIKQLIDGAN
ncbi:MAG: patatin-like phospholipase family protein [Candidatus Obscuribacterales bacterium]|nr:patatin-like phospholipase family protein [Candidatus Obscuribacterales bacterium]